MSERHTARQRHLLGVWNASYEADDMDAHVTLLLRAAREFRDGVRDEDDVYVWWGKVRSSNRQQPLEHLDQILSIDEELEGDGGEEPEIHLYLTDYRSLYVAHLAGVTAEDMRDATGHVPDYYRRKALNCDCWFQLWDIRRLILDDTPAVVELAAVRIPAAHSGQIDRAEVTRFRNWLIGVGEKGVLLDLAQVRLRGSGAMW